MFVNQDLVANNAKMYEMLGEQYVSVYGVPLPNVEQPSDNDNDNNGCPRNYKRYNGLKQ